MKKANANKLSTKPLIFDLNSAKKEINKLKIRVSKLEKAVAILKSEKCC